MFFKNKYDFRNICSCMKYAETKIVFEYHCKTVNNADTNFILKGLSYICNIIETRDIQMYKFLNQ